MGRDASNVRRFQRLFDAHGDYALALGYTFGMFVVIPVLGILVLR